jgi:transcriptional regulator with XRE-family HTH domain
LSPKRLGVTIKKLRTERNMTQEELAQKVGVHRVYIAQIESATKVPSIATLEKLAKALRVKLVDLVK